MYRTQPCNADSLPPEPYRVKKILTMDPIEPQAMYSDSWNRMRDIRIYRQCRAHYGENLFPAFYPCLMPCELVLWIRIFSRVVLSVQHSCRSTGGRPDRHGPRVGNPSFCCTERWAGHRREGLCTIFSKLARLTAGMPTNNYISVIEKTMRVLEAIRGKREVPLGEIASATGLIKSNTFRILFTLENLGYVEKSDGGRYSLTSRMGRLTSDGRPSPDLGALAEPFMAELLRRFSETVNLGVLDNGEVLYLRVVESSHAFRLAAHAGMRSPVYSTALGKCLLCCLPRPEIEAVLKKHPMQRLTPRTITDRAGFYRELDRVRARGYSVDNQEDSSGARCLAAPILTAAGEVRAAISISGPAVRMVPPRDREISQALIDACGKVARLLGYATGKKGKAVRGDH